MSKEIIINAAEEQQRIAIVEDAKLSALFYESDARERMVGDIYFGRVAKVMPGIQACFIDVGLEQDAFLHYSDISDAFRESSTAVSDENAAANTDTTVDEGDSKDRPKDKDRDRRRTHSRVTLQRGQEILVQVFKEPVGNKGVRVTTEITLAGRFIVLMPFDKSIGVSRKISSFREKRRLRKLAHSILPYGFGCIIRTVAEGREEEALKNDLMTLLQNWREIERKVRQIPPPALIYKDMDSSASVIRDLFSEDVTRVAVDSRPLWREIRAYVNMVAPEKSEAIEYYRGPEPIFDHYGVEKQVEESFRRKVWLKSGGYIIIEHTEAMKVIDVNSGRFVGKAEQEMNSLRTNLEAAREIAHQIMLRDLGGIIVIDYIDMDHEENRRKLLEEMKKEMRRDRAKYTILPVTDFGLMQITRQRIRESVTITHTEVCPTCTGTGRVESQAALGTRLERWLKRFRTQSRELRLLLVVHPAMMPFLTEGAKPLLRTLMLKFFVKFTVIQDPSQPVDQFKVMLRHNRLDITARYSEAPRVAT